MWAKNENFQDGIWFMILNVCIYIRTGWGTGRRKNIGDKNSGGALSQKILKVVLI